MYVGAVRLDSIYLHAIDGAAVESGWNLDRIDDCAVIWAISVGKEWNENYRSLSNGNVFYNDEIRSTQLDLSFLMASYQKIIDISRRSYLY